MIRWLVDSSLRLRVPVLALAVLLIVAGIQASRRVSLDVFPEFAPPLVEVQTEAPGLSTADVESLVTVPLETFLNGTPWLQTLRSKSVLGLSSVLLIFDSGADIFRARQLVQERIAANAGRLPAVAKPPVILPPVSSTSRVLKIGMTSRALSRMDLSVLARWTVRPRLMALSGVANVAVWGERERQLQVRVDPARLRAHGVDLDTVISAAGDAVAVGPGGFVDTPNQRLSVRQEAAVRTPEDLALTVLRSAAGAPLTLGNVATVAVGSPPPIGDAVINDGPGLLLVVEKEPAANSLEVTRRIEAAIADLRPGLGEVDLDTTIFRPATFIEHALANLREAMLLGCVFVIAVLVLFLFDWRAALISSTAIPLSILAATLVLTWLGVSINTMVLAGLVIALGEVVDDAVIDVENIGRRLRLNAASGGAQSSYAVVLAASLEVRSAVVYASAIVVLVFLPVFFLEGLAGAFFRPLAMAYMLAVAASLVVALTVTPALSLLLLPASASARRSEPPVVRRLKRGYRRLLPWFATRPGLALAVLVASIGLSGLAAAALGEEFLPHFKERDFLMHWVEKPGASLDAVTRATVRVSKELRAIPGVRNSFGAHIGRAEVADEVVGPNFAELWMSIEPGADYEATVARIQEVVDGYPGIYHDVLTFLRERIKEVLTGASASVVVRIYGPELDVLRAKAEEIAQAIAGVKGVADLKVEPQVLVPQVDVRLRPEAAARLGLRPAAVRRAVATMLQGTKVGEVYEAQKIFDVVVRGVEESGRDVAALGEILIATPSGAHVPLGEVADIAVVPAPNVIQREGASRRIDVTLNAAGRDLSRVAEEVEARVRKISFPRGYHPEFLGEWREAQASKLRLLGLTLAACAGILLILQVDFGSLRLALLVFLTLPFALAGGALGAACGGVLSLGSLVGFVTVLGIAARNAILLVSHYRHLEAEGAELGPELVLRGAEERLAPILMTALTTALALVPLVAAGNVAGHEIEYPMALVILGGLGSSTVLNLLFLPALYGRFGHPRRDERA